MTGRPRGLLDQPINQWFWLKNGPTLRNTVNVMRFRGGTDNYSRDDVVYLLPRMPIRRGGV